MHHDLEEVKEPDPFIGSLGLDSTWPPGFRIYFHVTTSPSIGGVPVSCAQLSEGGINVVYPPLIVVVGVSSVIKVLIRYG